MSGNPYLSGWCVNCGRRRGSDGRCVNCDPWWTSPLIQVGTPALAACCLLLVGIVAAVSPKRPDPALSGSESARPPASLPLFSAPMRPSSFAPLVAPPPPAAPPALAAMPTLSPEFFAPKPPPDAAQMAAFDELRYRVRLASGQMRSLQAQSRPLVYQESQGKTVPGTIQVGQPL